MNAPLVFPPLPDPSPPISTWSANVYTVYESCMGAYQQGITLIQEQCSDPVRLESTWEWLLDCCPLVVGLTFEMPGQTPGGMNPWLKTCAQAMVALENDLQSVEEHAKGQ